MSVLYQDTFFRWRKCLFYCPSVYLSSDYKFWSRLPIRWYKHAFMAVSIRDFPICTVLGRERYMLCSKIYPFSTQYCMFYNAARSYSDNQGYIIMLYNCVIASMWEIRIFIKSNSLIVRFLVEKSLIPREIWFVFWRKTLIELLSIDSEPAFI